jgi:apolipoprotein N-acyltransferase
VSAAKEEQTGLAGDNRRAQNLAAQFSIFVRALNGWPRVAVAVGAGALSVLSLAPFFLWPILFFTMPVLVWLIDGASPDVLEGDLQQSQETKRAFAAGWLFGFGYFAAGLFWIGEAFLVEAEVFAWLMPFAVTLLPAGLALFWGLATAAAKTLWQPGLARVLVLAISLGAIEWLRGHVLTGFPWNAIGYTLTSSDALMQSAAIVGVYSLSLWAVLIFAGPLVLLAAIPSGEHLGSERPSVRKMAIAKAVAVAAFPLMLAGAFGAWRLAQDNPPDVPNVKLRIVQPSIPQREKWLPEKQGEIFQLHLSLSRQAQSGEIDDLRGVTHLIWPEAAMPFRPLDHPEALDAIKNLIGSSTYLFSGGLRVVNAPPAPGVDPSVAKTRDRPKAYNSLLVFGPGGGLAAIYDKIHLVPFGEYLPFQPTLEAIGLNQLTHQRGGFSTGPEPRQPINVAGLPPATILICYEAIFPGQAVQSAERPGLIINITNDGWFGNTSGPRQHFHQSRVRAVEEGLPLIRSANNGISAIVDPNGRTRQMMGMNERGVIDTSLPSALPVTPYGRFGDWMFLLNLAVFALAAAGLARQ